MAMGMVSVSLSQLNSPSGQVTICITTRKKRRRDSDGCQRGGHLFFWQGHVRKAASSPSEICSVWDVFGVQSECLILELRYKNGDYGEHGRHETSHVSPARARTHTYPTQTQSTKTKRSNTSLSLSIQSPTWTTINLTHSCGSCFFFFWKGGS